MNSNKFSLVLEHKTKRKIKHNFMPKMVPFTAFCWRRRTPPGQWRYPCLCRQNGVGTSPPPTLTRRTYFKRFYLHRLNYNSLSVKQQPCFTVSTTERKLQYSSIRGWVVAISLLKIWGRPPYWIWPKVDFHNFLGTAASWSIPGFAV